MWEVRETEGETEDDSYLGTFNEGMKHSHISLG